MEPLALGHQGSRCVLFSTESPLTKRGQSVFQVSVSRPLSRPGKWMQRGETSLRRPVLRRQEPLLWPLKRFPRLPGLEATESRAGTTCSGSNPVQNVNRPRYPRPHSQLFTEWRFFFFSLHI